MAVRLILYQLGTVLLLSLSVMYAAEPRRSSKGNLAYPPKLEGARAEVYKRIGETELQPFIFAPERDESSTSV